MTSLFRPVDGALPYTAAFAYSVAANAAGLALCLQVSGALPPPPAHPVLVGLAGVLLSAHGRIVASYLVHELAHSSVFKSRKLNTGFGIVCTWLCVAAWRSALWRSCSRFPSQLRCPLLLVQPRALAAHRPPLRPGR